jgi:hypothetical protein
MAEGNLQNLASRPSFGRLLEAAQVERVERVERVESRAAEIGSGRELMIWNLIRRDMGSYI